MSLFNGEDKMGDQRFGHLYNNRIDKTNKKHLAFGALLRVDGRCLSFEAI